MTTLDAYIKKKFRHIQGYDFNGLKRLHQSIINKNIPSPLEKNYCVGEDFVRCLVCEKEFGSTITTHVRRMHGIPMSTYRVYFGVPKAWTMTPRYRDKKVNSMLSAWDEGNMVGWSEGGLRKAEVWRKKHHKEVVSRALAASRAGDKARREYFSDPKKFMPSLTKANNKWKELWKDPKYRAKKLTDRNSPSYKFIQMRKKRHEELMGWYRICPNCGKRFSCFTDGDGRDIKARSLRFFKEEKLFCSNKCVHEARRGTNFASWIIKAKQLRKTYKAKRKV